MSEEQTTQVTEPVAETTQTTEPVAPTIATTNNSTPATWKDSISQEFREDPNISKFTEIDALAKSYINATRMIGQDKVAVPNENSTDDQWNEVYGKLGRPESADKYKLEVNSETAQIDESSIKSFAENAHKLGLNNKQAQGILEYYKDSMEGSAQQSKIDTETAQAQSEAELRKEWGRSFDENLKKAASVAKANMNEDVLNMQLKDGTRLGDHPSIIKGFANIANLMSEDKMIGTDEDSATGGRNLDEEISKIVNDRDGPYWNKGHPEHDKVVQQVFTLRSMK
ncbi:hypothetical protein N9A10_01160 [Candidatus Pelagibacter sp.]|nr:hypothetical protein [Candidatus Pelagibacter sp.]